jgi:hypothetical protein
VCPFQVQQALLLKCLVSLTSLLSYSYVEELHGRTERWGTVLDAGTGSHSLGWLLALDSDSVTAVTGDNAMLRDVQKDFQGKLRSQDRLVIGNWKVGCRGKSENSFVV